MGRTMKRSAGALALLLAAALLCSSCREEPPRETLLIAGSTTMQGYLEPLVAAFQKSHPRASVVSEPGGSTAGLVALKRGAIDVATIAREVTADEDDLHLHDYLVARDGVAIVVNKQNPLDDIAVHQIAQVCTGEIRTWKALAKQGTPAADLEKLEKLGEITLLDRPKSSHTRKSLLDLVLGGDDSIHGAREVADTKEMDEAIKADPRAMSYVALHWLHEGVKALRVEDVPMSRTTMMSGRYKLTRSFYLAVYLNPSPVTEQFVEFTLSPEGQKLLENDGLLGVH
jgi:phosphate transport system substrate-binding protein